MFDVYKEVICKLLIIVKHNFEEGIQSFDLMLNSYAL